MRNRFFCHHLPIALLFLTNHITQMIHILYSPKLLVLP